MKRLFLQNFEDWDDVGLNIPQPPDLLHLYRDYNNHTMPERNVTSCETQTDETVEYIDSLEAAIIELKEELATVKKNLVSFLF
ncbi:hypothetical protein DPMN_175644 [Dreissena polymorpha]|uniref:Uncharacterized protein n=1 Tax=Dreissena polymorpha TaxID=45954 RepID=A0A9D4E7P5_DREPO|nr:hypothetical protein DPMN_175644 [Dreissena polymorpha]